MFIHPNVTCIYYVIGYYYHSVSIKYVQSLHTKDKFHIPMSNFTLVKCFMLTAINISIVPHTKN